GALIPTLRLVTLAGFLVLVALAAGYLGELALPLVVLDMALVVAVVSDGLLARGHRVEIERQMASIFSVGRPNVITLHLRNRSGRVLTGVVVDDPVTDCTATGIPARFTLGAHASATVRYELLPTRRGPRELGSVTVRYASVLGLLFRQERVALGGRVDVYPDVHAARSLELLRRQGRQDARLGSLRVHGGDTEFERLRPYQRGDEIRHLDWRASARRDDPTVRQFQAESNQNVVFAIDIGRAMRGESGGLTSVDHALNAALLTADVALRAGDKAGLMVFDEAPRKFLQPTGGRSGGHKLTRAVYALEASFAATDYRAALAFLRTQVRARSLVIVFTNLLDARSAKELSSSLRGLLPRHLPLCVLLRDQDVEALAVAPAESDERRYVQAAAAESLAERDTLLHALQRSGVLVLDAKPSEVTPELVKRYLEVKSRRLL
ncbi:MAG: DUF58 domain-containing protein, partial [Myxococcales bacterium]